jgi:hypothetical protein
MTEQGPGGFVTTVEQRRGILVAVISGGRPELRHRPTASFLPALHTAGVADVIWSVSEPDAPGYEPDAHPLSVYPRGWAEEYAAAHWMHPDPPAPEAFLGAFPGREWACREAERRGCWAVLQLDDNIDLLKFLRGTASSQRLVTDRGGLSLFVDLLAAVMLSTNARMAGAQLDSVNPASLETKVARVGFPYSLFLERVGPSREEWFGPFEDDITHALQYGSRADGATTALVPTLHYHKENQSRTGMRKHYDPARSQQLQRLFPQAATVGVRKTRSNGRGEPRVFHKMPRGAIRNPLIVRDPVLFGAVRGRLQDLAAEWLVAEEAGNRAKVARRTRSVTPADPAG